MRKFTRNKFIMIILFVLSFNILAQKGNYEIINIIPSPTPDTRDLAYDGEYLWTGASLSNLLFKLSPVDGSIIKTIPTTIVKPYGLTFDGTYLWAADNVNKIIQQIDTSDGTVIKTFSTPAYIGESYPYGLAWDGTNLWHNDTKGPNINTSGDSTFYIDTNGDILAAYSAKGGYPTGLAFDGEFLWSSDNELNVINKIRVSDFNIVETIDAPGGNYPNGLTWDGQYLWVGNNDSDSLYQLDVSGGTPVEDETVLPNKFCLLQNYPNPFNPSTKISWQSAVSSRQTLKIYDALGNEVATLLDEFKQAGEYEIEFNAFSFPSGIYFYQIKAGDLVQTKKMILLK